MGRRRVAGVLLPRGVRVVRSKGRTYYYYHPGRGTGREAEPTRLPDPSSHPAAFGREIERLTGKAPPAPQGTVASLVARYRLSDDFLRLTPSTRTVYEVSLRRIESPAGWGLLGPRQISAAGIVAVRDGLKATPSMANQMLSVGRTVWDWAIPLGEVEINPFDKVRDLEVPDRGHVPWPAWAVDLALAGAPEDLRRMVQLGTATCQRESDLVRFGPQHRQGMGIWCRPVKTRKRRRAFLIPLATTDGLLLDRWASAPITFTAKRIKTPLAHHRDDLYLYSPRGAPYSPSSLRARWGRWLTGTKAGKELCARWRAWLAECVERYEWEIEPEDARGPTIHGLRGTGILRRHAEGFDVDQIANDVGMSRQMVDHYMRFRDQMAVAIDGRRRLKLIKEG